MPDGQQRHRSRRRARQFLCVAHVGGLREGRRSHGPQVATRVRHESRRLLRLKRIALAVLRRLQRRCKLGLRLDAHVRAGDRWRFVLRRLKRLCNVGPRLEVRVRVGDRWFFALQGDVGRSGPLEVERTGLRLGPGSGLVAALESTSIRRHLGSLCGPHQRTAWGRDARRVNAGGHVTGPAGDRRLLVLVPHLPRINHVVGCRDCQQLLPRRPGAERYRCGIDSPWFFRGGFRGARERDVARRGPERHPRRRRRSCGLGRRCRLSDRVFQAVAEVQIVAPARRRVWRRRDLARVRESIRDPLVEPSVGELEVPRDGRSRGIHLKKVVEERPDRRHAWRSGR
mmetsp:Transcript_43625/g.120712  ORF Transcript_43625/g.120712 Transcript_43625/m.120712 type:complete len:341 (+) Transcript_43625:1836-2858(+)